jgi:hypothetical protein
MIVGPHLQNLALCCRGIQHCLHSNEKALSETVTQLTIEKARLDRDLGTRQLVADQDVNPVLKKDADLQILPQARIGSFDACLGLLHEHDFLIRDKLSSAQIPILS